MSAKPESLGGINLALESLMAPEARRKEIQAAADALLKAAEREIRAAGGPAPRHKTLVDGRAVSDLGNVDPNCREITFVFETGIPVEVLTATLDLLRNNSPVRTGSYKNSHRIYFDKNDVTDQWPVDQADVAKAKEIVIQPTVIYGRKVENWHGVYEAATAVAQRKFGNQAKIWFEFRSPILPYVAGGANREERAAIRTQANRRAAMRTERQTRLPCIFFSALGD